MPPAASSSRRLADCGRLEHRVAVELEVDTAEQAQRLVVVDDQDRLAGPPATAAASVDGCGARGRYRRPGMMAGIEHRHQSGPAVRGHDGRLLERAVRDAARTRCDRRATRTGSTGADGRRCAHSSTGCTGRASCSRASTRRTGAGCAHASSRTRSSTRGIRPREVAEALELCGPKRRSRAPLRMARRALPGPARAHAAGRESSARPSEPQPRSAAVLGRAASLLALFGAVAFVTGAALVLWPLWAAGLALVAGGLLVHRP